MTRLVNGIIGIIEVGFLLRLALQLFRADPSSPFVAWLYGITDQLAAPFAGAFPIVAFGGNFTIDLSIVLAMVCYAILGSLIVLVLSFYFGSRSTISIHNK